MEYYRREAVGVPWWSSEWPVNSFQNIRTFLRTLTDELQFVKGGLKSEIAA